MVLKYIGSICCNEVEKLKLMIKNCNELDIGIYFFMVYCSNNLFIESNKINLEVVEGKIFFFKLYE